MRASTSPAAYIPAMPAISAVSAQSSGEPVPTARERYAAPTPAATSATAACTRPSRRTTTACGAIASARVRAVSVSKPSGVGVLVCLCGPHP